MGQGGGLGGMGAFCLAVEFHRGGSPTNGAGPSSFFFFTQSASGPLGLLSVLAVISVHP